MPAGRPRKWAGLELRYRTIYVPVYLLDACTELGFKTPSDAFYELVKERILNNGSSLKDHFIIQENFTHPVKPDGSETISLDSQVSALDQYIRSLLPSQVASLRLKAERGNIADLAQYQEAIKDVTGIWVKPSVIMNRFYIDETKEVNHGSTDERA